MSGPTPTPPTGGAGSNPWTVRGLDGMLRLLDDFKAALDEDKKRGTEVKEAAE